MSNPATVVEHVVVLMLENRSFDHMLGWMKSHIPFERSRRHSVEPRGCFEPGGASLRLE